MKSIIFENSGEIDVDAITTFGINVKENDDPIGYFGTGLKYAIAVLIRNHCKIRIASGEELYVFSKIRKQVRGVDFDFITMNEKVLGFTTELGKNWEMWMAYRELHCNTTDEGGTIKEKKWGTIKSKKGFTQVQVAGQEIMDAHTVRHHYILGERELKDNGRRANAYAGQTTGIYYRGIRIKSLHDSVSLMRYDITSSITLTEDRTAKYDHELTFPIMELILRSENKAFLREVLSAQEGFYEWNLNFANATSDPGETFLDVMTELREQTKDVGLNMSSVSLHREKREKSILPAEGDYSMNEVQRTQLSKAKTFVHTVLGCDMYRFPIIVAKDLGKHGLGRAEDGKIFIAAECFEQGTKRVAAALYEEWTHLDSGCADESLEQKWIYLQKILSLGEQLTGEPL
jgi:hypothetical protein